MYYGVSELNGFPTKKNPWNMRYKINASKGFSNDRPTKQMKQKSFHSSKNYDNVRKKLERTHIYTENLTGQPKEL